MTTIIHAGKSRTVPVTAADGSAIVGLTASTSNPAAVTVQVNPDNTVTRHAAAGVGSAGALVGVTYTAPGYGSVAEAIQVPAPVALVLGVDGPEV